jgi:ATP-dependent Clp protease ATP-binding subunit ClpC
LSVAGVLAGGSESGAGERLYRALDEAAHSGNVVLFIKDIHNIVGVSVSGGKAGGVGIEQILAQGLENSHFLVIGTSDYRNYPRYIENSALQSVLVKIDIPEPDFNETILMLESRVPFVEGQQNVFFTYQSLEKAVELTNKLIHTEYQPEKSLKILQETASRVRALRGKKAVVTENDIAEVISAKVNMPLTKIQKTEQDKLLNLEKEIHLKFINQELAVKEVAEALRRARAELRDERRPIANFLFVGPTGVGKTELVKRLATIYFNSEKDIIRLDMSEFQEVSSIERLLGSANSPGLLTQPVKESPFGILLLDELEKAHPNIFNLFLQVMDDGRLTSGAGEVIDFTNLIIVMTSNAGTKILQDRLSQGKTIEEIKEEFVKKDLLKFFRPEFLNRFDAVIVFKPLTQENIEQIAGLILADLAGRLEKKGIALKWTEEAMKELAHLGFDPLYGARPLRRAIQEHVQNVLANYLLSGAIGRRDVVYLEPGGKIRVEKAVEL